MHPLMYLIALLICLLPIPIKLIQMKKMKAKQEEEEQFCNVVIKETTSMLDFLETSEGRKYYVNVFDSVLTQKKGIVLSHYDQYLHQIPALKDKFSDSLRMLVSLSENNTVFHENQVDGKFISDSEISNDIVKTLPILAQYIDAYNSLHQEIYNDQLGHFTTLCMDLFAYIADENEKPDEYQILVQFLYNCYNKMMWGLIKDDSQYTQYHSEEFYEKYKAVNREHPELFNRWKKLWFTNMWEIADP